MRDPNGLRWGEVSATAALGTLPIIALAIILQKCPALGLSLGSLK
jgi:ABC-type maltose transport system permease subunit